MTNIASPTRRRAHAHAMGWPSRDSAHARKRQANDYMRKGLPRPDQNEAIPFFCECDQPGCFAAVWLTGLAYDQLLGSSPDSVLTATHATQAAA